MAVAFDASSVSGDGTGNLTWTHTPVGTPRGALVFVIQNSGADEVSGVTYGGTAMTEVAGSPCLHTTGEPGSVYAYLLGASVPTGARSVVVTVTGSSQKRAVAYTVTAANDTEVVDSDGTIKSDSLANPTVTLSLAARTCFCALGFHSGQNATSGNVPFTNWTATTARDFGFQTGGVSRYNIVGTADVSAGWTMTAEDAAMMAVAISELSVAAPSLLFRSNPMTPFLVR